MKPDRVLSMLGIAAKAGSVASGEFSTEKAVKEGRAYLVIVASDASDNTKKMFRNMTDFYQVPMYEYSDKEIWAFHWKRISCIACSHKRGTVALDRRETETRITTE